MPDGSVVALLGPNGAGKSTTLRTISGVVRAEHGTITAFGTRIDRVPAYRIARMGIVHVPEGRGIFPSLSVRENLDMASTFADVADPVGEATQLFPVLGNRLRQTAGSLSGGEQQMLALARALMARPRLLMVDEISMGLAPIIVGQLFDALRTIAASGTSLLLVEQYVETALDLADYVYVMEKGASSTWASRPTCGRATWPRPISAVRHEGALRWSGGAAARRGRRWCSGRWRWPSSAWRAGGAGGGASADTSLVGYNASALAIGSQYAFNIPGLVPLPNENLIEEDVPFARTNVGAGPVVDSIGAPYYPGDIAANLGSLLLEFGAPSLPVNDPLLAESKYPASPGYTGSASFGVAPSQATPAEPSIYSSTSTASDSGGSAPGTVSDLSLANLAPATSVTAAVGSLAGGGSRSGGGGARRACSTSGTSAPPTPSPSAARRSPRPPRPRSSHSTSPA